MRRGNTTLRMFGWLLNWLKKIFGDTNEKALKKLWSIVHGINELEPEALRLTDEQLRARTDEFKARLSEGEKLDDLLPEAFAVVREAARRTLEQRHFDVQLLGGIVLHQGKISEMKTGEGKTLVATLPVYLNALLGHGVHVVTVNDYLARRDPVWMGPIYHLLGLSVGCLQHETAYVYDPAVVDGSLNSLRPVPRHEAYAADVTYGTNNEFGFDYLRDNMVLEADRRVQQELRYAIVDEVDNILIDEARTPLIISGPADEPIQLYSTFAKLVPRLQLEVDYTIDEKTRAVSLTPEGISKMEQSIRVGNLYSPENFHLVHYLENALRAHAVYQRDKEYVVRDGEVVIVDEFTGRLQFGRRYSDGLHQAIEAKESVRIQRESITYATITLQNYFRLYQKLAGMTGTAATESEEFLKIYNLDVVVIPTNQLMIRKGFSDVVYPTEEAKWRAVASDIEENCRKGRPVLVGTTSIEKSEKLSAMLKRRGVPHQVLNAKQHEKEAGVIVQAGRPGTVTVATSMAGRGTDIVLGGNPAGLEITPEQWQKDHDSVISLGGLYVLGTEHYEARRIDNQLRGRSGRQGDPGSSRFYASLEDDVISRFGGERIKGLVIRLAGEDTAIENRMITKTLENAQVKVEGYHFDIRKHLLEYDDVLNKQREIIYNERRKTLDGADLKANILSLISQEIEGLMSTHLPGNDPENWNVEGFLGEMKGLFSLPSELNGAEKLARFSRDEIEEKLQAHAREFYEEREGQMGEENMRTLERLVMLRTMDVHWVQHLTTMENLRQGIGLHAFGQRDPLVMYRKEGHRMFQEFLDRIQHQVTHTIYNVSLAPAAAGAGSKAPTTKESPIAAVASKGREAVVAGARKVGRNEPCPCGSGKKYKRCHGA